MLSNRRREHSTGWCGERRTPATEKRPPVYQNSVLSHAIPMRRTTTAIVLALDTRPFSTQPTRYACDIAPRGSSVMNAGWQPVFDRLMDSAAQVVVETRGGSLLNRSRSIKPPTAFASPACAPGTIDHCWLARVPLDAVERPRPAGR